MIFETVYLTFFIVLSIVIGYILNNIFRVFAHIEDVEVLQENKPLLESYKKNSKVVANIFESIQWSNILRLCVNGNDFEITNPDPATLLSTYIRDELELKGTKLGCEEGGCGACTVTIRNPAGKVLSVNSCLRPLCANDGFSITTVEGIGSVKDGLSEEQKRLVAKNGTQCGYCTPGWINNMHALNTSTAETGDILTRRDIETYLDGNICRCTGYKPILEAFHSFNTVGKNCGCDKVDDKHDFDSPNCRSCPKSTQCVVKGYCIEDVEDISQNKCCDGSLKKIVPLPKKNRKQYVPVPLMFYSAEANKRWIRPVDLQQLCAVVTYFPRETIQFVGGNTSIGVTKYLNGTAPYNSADEYSVMVDVNSISAMVDHDYQSESKTLTVGAATSITQLIALLSKYSSSQHEKVSPNTIDYTSVFSVTAHHLSLIANTQVRNSASWTGNLMMFLKYPEFPSDAVLAFTTAKAVLRLINAADGSQVSMSMQDFLSCNWTIFLCQQYIIVSLVITESQSTSQKSTNTTIITETFKIAARSRNAHAHVNAGFLFEIGASNNRLQTIQGTVPQIISAQVVYGGVSKTTFVAKRTINSLVGKLVNYDTLQLALYSLNLDLEEVGRSDAYGDQQYRESVMQTCLYRALLRCYPIETVPESVVSTLLPWVKPISRGTELYLPSDFPLPQLAEKMSSTNTFKKRLSNEAPVGKPVRKLEGPIQSTGEAVYPSDEKISSRGLHGALIFSTRCSVVLSKIDTAKALTLPGVVAVYTAVDIVGNNLSVGSEVLYIPIGSVVPCIGAPLGVIVATTEGAANKAAALVEMTYEPTGITPIANLAEAIEQKSFYDFNAPPVTYIRAGDPIKGLNEAPHRVQGHISANGQYHFYMEAQSATANVIDGKYIDVTCGTQGPAIYQSAIAGVLGMEENKVTIRCARSGGGFGGKITRGIPVAASAALCASKLGKQVRIFNTRSADMNMQGGREEWSVDYDVGFSDDGRITGLRYDIYVDAGITNDDTIGGLYMGMCWADNAYYLPNYVAQAKLCFTNTPSRTSMRAPGVVQACLATEMVMERVAVELGIPMTSVQSMNFISDGKTTILRQLIVDCTLPVVWSTLLSRSKYDERVTRIADFNKKNLWRKKGIAICPVKYGMGWAGYNAGIQLGVNAIDGTVTLSHNGAEIGQGINTKVAQVVAMALGIDLEMIRIISTGTDRVVNGGVTGGSGTSEVVCQASLNACATLNSRLEPFRASLTGPSNHHRSLKSIKKSVKESSEWVTLIASVPCDVSLNVEGWYSPTENPNQQPFQYFVYGACVTEVELDILNGAIHVLSSEIVYDCGQSLNPAIDCGQIEGGFVMGLGYFLTEKVAYESGTAKLLSAGTWEYKPPMVQEVPSVFNLTLLKNAYNVDGILGSKAVGEPCYVISNSIYFALKMAVRSARQDAGMTNGHFDLEVPATVELRQKACLVHPDRFVMPY